ncbi:MAG: ScyD/ScyE family protein, partial [Pseudonocardia sp.]
MAAVHGGFRTSGGRGRRGRRSLVAIAAGALIAGAPASLAAADDDDDDGTLRTVADGFDGPRGLAVAKHGKFVVAEGDGTFSQVKKGRNGHEAKVRELGSVPAGFIAPAVDTGKRGKVYILTAGGPPGSGAASLYKWRWGDSEPELVADIGAYQVDDPDPDDLEGHPEESNPFGLAALKDGSVLVSDAAANDLLRVYPDGDIDTVARLKPREVEVPEGIEEDGNGDPTGFPSAGTEMLSEAVATSVTVGDDGYWYVGELRGFPATPGTSQIWRIEPGTTDAECDPEEPDEGDCQRYADGLTSIVDLAADDDDNIYAVELSKMSWLQWELGLPDSEIGGLFQVSEHDEARELVEDQLVLPGNVDIGRND